MEQKKFYVYLVEIDRSIGIADAKRLSNKLLQAKRCKPYGETDTHYKFKNLPRYLFDPESFKRYTYSSIATIVYGQLKSNLRDIDNDDPPGPPQETTTDAISGL